MCESLEGDAAFVGEKWDDEDSMGVTSGVGCSDDGRTNVAVLRLSPSAHPDEYKHKDVVPSGLVDIAQQHLQVHPRPARRRLTWRAQRGFR